jgi:hypothetical protein
MHSGSCLECIWSIWIIDLNEKPKLHSLKGYGKLFYLGCIKEFRYDKNAGSIKDLDAAGCWLW